jgi:hypothetical protein
MRIQYKWLIPIYIFQEMKLLSLKYNYNVLLPSSYTHISVSNLYISRICLPILPKGNMWTDPVKIQIAHRHMNVEIGTEAAQFPGKEYINGVFLAVYTSCWSTAGPARRGLGSSAGRTPGAAARPVLALTSRSGGGQTSTN